MSLLAGRGGLVRLGGETGIGKTRLAEELAETGRRQGTIVLWGRCWLPWSARRFGPPDYTRVAYLSAETL